MSEAAGVAGNVGKQRKAEARWFGMEWVGLGVSSPHSLSGQSHTHYQEGMCLALCHATEIIFNAKVIPGLVV